MPNPIEHAGDPLAGAGEITIRKATMADLDSLVQLRRMMFEAMGYENRAHLDASDTAVAAYFARAIPAGQFHGWLAFDAKGHAVATGGAVIDQHPPGPDHLSGQVGYLMNLVTIPGYRRRGIARRIMQVMVAWLADQGIRDVALHTSEMGRPLYEELGFRDSNEMRLVNFISF